MIQPAPGTYALVTGASSGIGEAFARRLAARGFALILSARSADRLTALARELEGLGAPEAIAVPVDLAEPDGPARLFAETEGRGRPVDLLVNNAGLGLHGRLDELPLPRVLELLHVNVLALTELSHRHLAAMRARRRGHILNVASTMAFLPIPFSAAYGASKAYILSFSQALHEEASDDGVTVTALCPGYTRTAFYATAGMKGPQGTPFPEMRAEDVAEAGLAALSAGKVLHVTHPLDRAWIFVGRFVPRALSARLARLHFARAAAKP